MSKTVQVLDRLSADHPVASLDEADRKAVNRILADYFEASIVVYDDPEEKWPYWIVQEVPE